MVIFFRKRQPKPPADPWPLDETAFPLSGDEGLTLRSLMDGTLVFGGVGSGKTTCMAGMLYRLLKRGFGAMIFTAKIEEVSHALRLCQRAGRLADVRLIGPRHNASINGLKYEFDASGHIENLAQLLTQFLDIAERRKGGGHENQFFQRSALLVARHALCLVTLATNDVTLPVMMNIVGTAPTHPWLPWPLEELKEEQRSQAAAWQERSICATAIRMCEERSSRFTPAHAADFAYARNYFLNEWPSLAPETRSSIAATLSSITDLFARAPLRELFCSETNTRPEESWESGRIFIHDAPIHRDGETGLYQQIGWKFLFQKAAMRRDTARFPRPVVLWEDEYQETSSRTLDQQFSCVSRSTRTAVVRMTQNISNLYSTNPNRPEVDSLIGNHRNLLFFACNDIPTMQLGEQLSGRVLRRFVSTTIQPRPYDPVASFWGEASTCTTSINRQFEHAVQGIEFSTLQKGGPHGFAEAIAFQGGAKFRDGNPFLRCTIPQFFT